MAFQKYETLQEREAHGTRELRVASFFWLVAWVLFGGIAALWWVPKALGASDPITWDLGAICLVAQWCMVFNHLPRVGTRQFFSNRRFFMVHLPLLVLITASFAAGFAIAA